MPKRKTYSNRLQHQFVTAKLHTNAKEWYISYYITDPETGELVRKRIRWNKIQDPVKRKKAGLEEVKRINAQLRSNWNPMVREAATLYYTPFGQAIEHYMREKTSQVKEGAVRSESYRTYKSYIRVFKDWVGHEFWNAPCVSLNPKLVDAFLDYIYLEKKRTARTRNNYQSFMNRMGIWMRQKRYLPHNPASDIPKLKEGPKRRDVIDEHWLHRIWDELQKNQVEYYTLCRTIFYCLVRRRELVHLQVKHLNIDRHTLFIPGHISKNRKDDIVTIPNVLIEELKVHVAKSRSQDDFLFGSTLFRPGPTMCDPKKVSDTWAKLRRRMQFPRAYQFYSLKDTGITTMLRRGLPSIVVRDQARHHDISITDKYTPKGLKKAADELIDYM